MKAGLQDGSSKSGIGCNHSYASACLLLLCWRHLILEFGTLQDIPFPVVFLDLADPSPTLSWRASKITADPLKH